MDFSKDGERRRSKRLDIDCPITVGIRTKGDGHGVDQGRLHDICIRGARFYLERSLAVGTRVALHVHFSNSDGLATKVRFEGVVTRRKEGLPHEIAVKFGRGGRFLRGELADLFKL